jgi:regulator of sigma E protease
VNNDRDPQPTPHHHDPAQDAAADAAAAADDSVQPTWGQWFANNAVMLAFIAAAIGFIVYKGLDVVDLLKVAAGLGLVIFIHELGHFLAAKWCDVHVETFSIGFGKAIPGCKFKYGETTYKVGWIPLGGYVKMVGEGENADTEEAEEDPRSFKNKRVGQRMLIISAGVIMNIFLAAVCFLVVYMHGVEEKPPIIGWVEAGSPAWQEGMHSEIVLDQIDNLKNPVFDDVRPVVMGTNKGETVRFVYREKPGGPEIVAVVEPGRDSEALFPVVGVGPASQLVLAQSRKGDFKPVRPGSPAAAANAFRQGDRVIACSDDPADPKKVTPIPPDKRDGAAGKLDYFAFQRRLHDLRGKPMIVRVERDGGATEDITLGPAYYVTTGMRMEMGRLAARRKDSPAARAKVVSPAGEEDGLQVRKPDAKETTGDKIISVEVETGPDRSLRWLSGQGQTETHPEGKRTVEVRPLDPLRLPYELERWADTHPGAKTLKVEVLRPTAPKEQKSETKRVTLEMDWDDSAKYYREIQTTPNSPLSIPCLGLAYHVEAVVEDVAEGTPAAAAGMQKGDLIKEIRWKEMVKGEVKPSKWQEIKSHQWAYVFAALQAMDPKEIDLKVERGGGTVEATLKAEPDETWPIADRGLYFQLDTRLHKASDLLDALGLGLHRTVRTVRVIYQNLYAMVFGRVSAWTMSGPLTIADVSYKIAGENLWQFILFIGMINVNLAVINFLPIPVLDGGHMVFLLYEKIRGKPAPESVLAAAMYTGLALILALMCFVLFLDVKRLFF